MITAPNLDGIGGLHHGFGLRNSVYPIGITTVKQNHSALVIDAAECPGEIVRQGDALISNAKGVLAGVKTADCVPILLVDTSTHAVAAVHAGWRGTAARIVAAVLREMAAKWGVKPRNVRAAIGPAIGVCCYEVGPDVASRFGMDVSSPVHLDLPFLNERQLREAGVRDIWKSGECTFCNAQRFFSFRREKENAGRMISFVGWS